MKAIGFILLFAGALLFPIFLIFGIISIFNSDLRHRFVLFALGAIASTIIFFVGMIMANGGKTTNKVIEPTDFVSDVSEIKELRAMLKKNYDIKEPSKFAIDKSDGDHWRIQSVANSTPPADYALEYAKAYMNEGDIHFIVNFSLKTTTSYQIIAGKLTVKTYEYVEKEELDASIIGSGPLYTTEYYDMVTGEQITTEPSADAVPVDANTLIAAVKEKIEGKVGKDEKITDVSFDGSDLKITVDLSEAEPEILTKKDLAISRIESITDAILALGDDYYVTWNTVTVDLGEEGIVTLDKSMVVDEGFGKYFNFPMDILD